MSAVAMPAATTVAVKPTAPAFILTSDADDDFIVSIDFFTGIVKNGTENSNPT